MIEFGERRWNDIDRGKPRNSEKNLSQCHFAHHKSHMDWPRRKPGPRRWEAGDYRPGPWHGPKQHLNRTIIHLYRTNHGNHCMRYKMYTLRYQMSKPHYLLYMFRLKDPIIRSHHESYTYHCQNVVTHHLFIMELIIVKIKYMIKYYKSTSWNFNNSHS
jgi:hypothetical protein